MSDPIQETENDLREQLERIAKLGVRIRNAPPVTEPKSAEWYEQLNADAESWADRYLDDRAVERRAETLWRDVAENGVDLQFSEAIADLGGSRVMLHDTTPAEWEYVADLIEGMLGSEPLKSDAPYSGARIILGMFASELRSYVRMAESAHA